MTAHCTRCDWFCFGLDTITDADRVLDAHHQTHHVHPDHRTQDHAQEASTAA